LAVLSEALRAGEFPQLGTLNIEDSDACVEAMAALAEALREGTHPYPQPQQLGLGTLTIEGRGRGCATIDN
jgi:hypothetical protein